MVDWIPRLAKRWFYGSSREFKVVLLVFFLFLAGGLAYIWPNVKIVRLAYDFQAQQRMHRELIRENILLRLERDSLKSLDRIEHLAARQLGLKEPETGQVVTVILK